jgi:hypothetical protein
MSMFLDLGNKTSASLPIIMVFCYKNISQNYQFIELQDHTIDCKTAP